MNFPTDAFLYNNLGAGDYNKADGRLGMESDKNKRKDDRLPGTCQL